MDPIVVGRLIGSVWAVRVFSEHGYVAWFLDHADALAFGEARYPENYILDHADIASVPGDNADEARSLAAGGV